MSNIIEKENIKIKNLIHEIRGKQVILDNDLANLYNVETKRINESVRRNKEKFSDRFIMILNNEEYNKLRSQNATSKINQHGGRRNNPTAFTEEGVAMLATILKSPIATQVSIAIMDAFVAMRKYFSKNLLEQAYINNQVLKNTEDIRLLQETMSKLETKKKVNEIYFNGQIYDAYSKIISIIKESKKELIIIDNYADNVVLDMISKINIPVIIITKNNNNLTKIDLKKYYSQYNNLTIIYNDTFHDRYLILDNKIIYHMGSSINHAGNKTFSINTLEDSLVINVLVNKINEIIKVK